MTASLSTLRIVFLGLSFALFATNHAMAAVSFTGSSYSQDFNSLAQSGTNNPWTNDSTIPGWYLFRQPDPGTAITSYNAGAGSSNAGNFFSFGLDADTDRALGGVASGGAYFSNPATNTVAGWIALGLTNSTGSTITSFTLNYDGEQWRDGGQGTFAPSFQTMVLEYGFGNTFETVATWNVAGVDFDFTSPVSEFAASALNGNEDANRVAGIGGTIADVAWNSNDTLWLRWIEKNDPGNDHGLAIDNFSFSTGDGPAGTPGDFNNDGKVDGLDFLMWQRDTSIGNLADWQNNYGTGSLAAVSVVPEPTSLAILALALVPVACGRRR
jgi:hypothetical protein